MKEPKIRFKGFRGEWETSIIGDMCSISTGKSNTQDKIEDGKYPFYVRSPFVERSNKFLFDEEAVLTVGDGVGTGKVFHYVNGKYDLHQRVYRMFDFCNIYAKYFYYYFSTKFYKRVMSMTAKSSVDSVRMDMIADMKIDYPSTVEQQSIASYFQHLDSLIQSTTKKIESLKQMKAASLQSMFPQEGETTPRVRFKGFEGEWSICPLKYFAKKSTEKNISMDYTKTLTNSAEYGVINQRDFFDHDISNDDHINGYYVIHHDDFVYNPRVSTAAPVGPISRNLLGYSGVMSPLYLIFRVNGINKDFLSYYFKTMLWHNYMKLEGNTGARFDRLAISDEQFFNMPICVPRDEKEQTVIASYFTTLDRQITLQTQRLEKLKQIKAACLDNMFV